MARAAERPLAARFARIFRRFDVVLTPVTAVPPLPVGAALGLSNWQTDKLMAAACPYAWPWNLLGWPAISVPAGFVGDHLPVGAQLGGPANSEALLLALAAELEAVSGWADQHPMTQLPGT
jgi:amidase